MEANTVELLGLFDTDVRYLVPIYQRNYKWDEKVHWGPLWDDIRNVAEDVLEYGESGDVVDHFLGAIVCEQQSSKGRDAKAVSVIDGQQRITTLALFIAALHRVCVERKFEEDAEYLAPMVENKSSVVRNRVEHRYKVWPNSADREGFLSAMGQCDGESRPERAVRFFMTQVGAWLDSGIDDDPFDDEDFTSGERMEGLINALMQYVKIVKIDLDPNDNAQLIFETLNGRGERLTDADLVRNALFRQADAEGSDAQALYDQFWAPFDDSRWSVAITHGRHQKDRLSLFLNQWLSMKKVDEVPASKLFQEFKDYMRKGSVPAESVAKDLAQHASVFDTFDAYPVNSREWWFFRRLGEMDLTTVQPVLLFLFSQPESVLTAEHRIRALDAIESYLVRRLITRSTTRSYGAVFIDVLKAAATGDPSLADHRIIELLMSRTSETDGWPSDDQMRTAVLNTNVYKLKQSRLKMVLEAIDVHRSSSGNTESITLGHALWIEHLLPQSWRTEPAWALPDGLEDPTAAAMERDHKLHTLGNLTLTTSKLDIGLSNRPWPDKVTELGLHTSLQLNRDIVAGAGPTWTEENIAARGSLLADDVIAIWPHGGVLLDQTP